MAGKIKRAIKRTRQYLRAPTDKQGTAPTKQSLRKKWKQERVDKRSCIKFAMKDGLSKSEARKACDRS
jgi:hypothetical protein